jgi:uncharacterized protein YdeI (YjbR/CyaY-like superfamily)
MSERTETNDGAARAVYFESPAAFRRWLKANHTRAKELLVGFHKAHRARSGVRTLTWPQSVAEALCFGWIDGKLKSVDADRYTIRFTPRRKDSKWSAVNVRMMAMLEASGRMTAAGRAAFESRPHKTGPLARGYTTPRRTGVLDAPSVRAFKTNPAAWAFFDSQPGGYKGATAWWVIQAKKEETKQRRLAKLIALSADRKRL